MTFAAGIIDVADLNDLEAASSGRPLVKLSQQAAVAMTNNTNVTQTFGAGSEDVDTHGFHSTSSNTSRITPDRTGYYLLQGTLSLTARADYQNIGCAVYKNGSAAGPWARRGESTFNVVKMVSCPATILTVDTIGDYFELIGYQVNGAAANPNTSVGSTGFLTTFECTYLRPL